jgi:hypothetical protein
MNLVTTPVTPATETVAPANLQPVDPFASMYNLPLTDPTLAQALQQWLDSGKSAADFPPYKLLIATGYDADELAATTLPSTETVASSEAANATETPAPTDPLAPTTAEVASTYAGASL